MKKYFGIMVVVLAISMSAFTAKHAVSPTSTFQYTNDDNPPHTSSPSNIITQSQFELCPLTIGEELCGEKWNVDNPSTPARVEKRYLNN